jgi:hypothetical protein
VIKPKKILMVGDSWGCGEITNLDHYSKTIISHPGVEQYLKDDGHKVVNLSMLGGSNADAYHLLQNYHKNYDIIIYWHTDPLRDLRPYHHDTWWDDSNALLVKMRDLRQANYEKFNRLGRRIFCLGGCSPLTSDINCFANLVAVIDKVSEFILPNFTHPDVWCSDWLAPLLESRPPEKMLHFLLAQKCQHDALLQEPLFIPDGHHPNRHGHKIVYDYLKKFID